MNLGKYSKAETLKYLESRVKTFKVPTFIYFKASDFNSDPLAIIEDITRNFTSTLLAIRSSSFKEDGEGCTAAGEYDSVLNVDADDNASIEKAIRTVIASFQRKYNSHDCDQIIVQKMVQNTSMSGVVFTHDLNTGAPYYVINYDDISGLTDTVTSGGGQYSNRTLYVHRGATKSIRSDRFLKLLLAIRELEKIMNSQFLDIEFAIGRDLVPCLLQVRSITTQPNWNRAISKRIDATLSGVQLFIRDKFKPLSGVHGQTTVLGQMPDWNPVEMIGRAPRALSFSLYQVLITDHAWRDAREIMNYKVPHGKPLMHSLAGQPYIDTRLSFHSYLPSDLSPIISEKLVNGWLKKFRNNPHLHDKVEFDIAITAYSFDIDDKIETLVGSMLNEIEKEEYKQALNKHTYSLVIGEGKYSVSNSLDKLKKLTIKQKAYNDKKNVDDFSVIFTMIEDCIRFGTIPFSVLARHAFIAHTVLISLCKQGIITKEEVDKIQRSVKTVASELVNDMRRLQKGILSNSEFMSVYGHLRPGTYDILSYRYDQMNDMGNNTVDVDPENPEELNTFVLSAKQRQQVDKLLSEHGFTNLTSEKLMDYIRQSIIAREYGKFIFTRSVSDILETVAAFGEAHGLSREEMSNIPINYLLEVMVKSQETGIEERLRRISERESEQHALSIAIRLPQVLFDEEGVHVVPFQVSHPNYITHKKITAPSVLLDTEMKNEVPPLNGKIVLIENADPGFDWIFAQKIGGLITKYGGTNSHMAIRCAEFGIPAAIGCGEQRFQELLDYNSILIDCAAGLISPVH